MLPFNLDGATQQVSLARTNKEAIEAIYRLSEEFYKTLGILLYTRYRYYLNKYPNEKINPEILDNIKKRFFEPNYYDWVELSNLCSIELLQKNDNFAAKLSIKGNSYLDGLQKECAKSIFLEIHKLINNKEIRPPRKITQASFSEIFRLVRNFRSHEWDDNQKLEPLMCAGIVEFVTEMIEKFFQDLPIITAKPYSCTQDMIETYFKNSQNITSERKSIPYENEHPELGKTYIIFDEKEGLFLIPCNLLDYDFENNRIFVYVKIRSSKKAKFTNVPITGIIESKEANIQDIKDLFYLTEYEMEHEDYELTLKQKFGKPVFINGIYHNVPLLVDYYVDRPILENKIIKALSRHHTWSLALVGGGGYGKTEIAKKIAYQIINGEINPEIEERLKFDLIIWVTAKQLYYENGEITKREPVFQNIEDLLDCILHLTGDRQIIQKDTDYKIKYISSSLARFNSILIILDNLETLPDQKGIWTYLSDLTDEIHPVRVKIITTSRVTLTEYGQYRVSVESMEKDEATALIEEHLIRYDILKRYQKPEPYQIINEISAGSPFLIERIIQLLSQGHNLDELKNIKPQNYENALNFICGYQWKDLSKISKDLLMSISYMGSRCSFSSAKLLCGIRDDSIFLNAKQALVERSFLIETELENSVLALLPPINNFVELQLRNYPNLIDQFSREKKILGIDSKRISAAYEPSQLLDEDIAFHTMISRAEAMIRVGALSEAHNWLLKVIDYFPENPIGWRRLGVFEYTYMDPITAEERFKKAIQLNKNDPVTYTTFAFYEHMRGKSEERERPILKSIKCNKVALDLLIDPNEKRKVTDHIGSAFLSLSELKRIEGDRQNNFSQKMETYNLSELYADKAIKIFKDNLINNPKTDDEIAHNVIDYQFLAKAQLKKARGDKKNKNFWHSQAVISILNGLSFDSSDRDLKYLLGDYNVKRILNKYYAFIDINGIDDKTIRELVNNRQSIEKDLIRLVQF